MNDILQIKGPFEHKNNPSIPGAPKLSTAGVVTVQHLKTLLQDLIDVIDEYSKISNKLIEDILISVYYNKVAAKSNRTSAYLKA
jgi:hypothetical protein